MVPTVELQLSFRVPLQSVDHTGGWFLSTLRPEFAGGGWLEQSGSVWAQDGRLLGCMPHCNLVRYES